MTRDAERPGSRVGRLFGEPPHHVTSTPHFRGGLRACVVGGAKTHHRETGNRKGDESRSITHSEPILSRRLPTRSPCKSTRGERERTRRCSPLSTPRTTAPVLCSNRRPVCSRRRTAAPVIGDRNVDGRDALPPVATTVLHQVRRRHDPGAAGCTQTREDEDRGSGVSSLRSSFRGDRRLAGMMPQCRPVASEYAGLGACC